MWWADEPDSYTCSTLSPSRASRARPAALGRVEEKASKNYTILYYLQYRHSCKVADEITLLGVGNEPTHEEEMTIDDCGGRREDSDNAETTIVLMGDNGTIDMNEEEKKKMN
ncbi:hypothetical protein YC2023_058032 [Brassica napus]